MHFDIIIKKCLIMKNIITIYLYIEHYIFRLKR